MFNSGANFAWYYLTEKEQYSREDSLRIMDRIVSLANEAISKLRGYITDSDKDHSDKSMKNMTEI